MLYVTGHSTPLTLFTIDRYRLMIRRVLSGSKKLGILMPKSKTVAAVELGAVGTLARITSFVALADGRFDITVMGEGRFEVKDDIKNIDGYFVANYAAYDDDDGTLEGITESDPPQPSLGELVETATQTLKDYEASIRFYPGRRRREVYQFSDDVATFSYQIAARLGLPPRIKRQVHYLFISEIFE